MAQGLNEKAEPIIRNALTVMRRALPEGHADIVLSLDALANVYKAMGREAEELAVRGELFELAVGVG